MSTISAQKGQRLYVMASAHIYWISTLATNRAECWKRATRFCKTNNPKQELHDEGWKCIPVQLSEQIKKS